MRHTIEFDGLQVLDIGRSLSRVQIDHEQFGTPPELQGSVVDFLFRNHEKMRSAALDWLISQHSRLFPYEDGDETRQRLELLLGNQGAVIRPGDQGRAEPWRVGDALRLELVLMTPELKITDRTPAALTEFAITEMVRNAYRRLHALEYPVVELFFSVFLQTTQPTQIPLEVLHDSAILHKTLTPSDATAVMKENPNFWKGQLQSICNSYLLAVCSDPRLLTLQNASMYQQIKRFFDEEE